VNKKLIKKYLRPLTPLPTGLTARGDPRAKINCILFDIYGTLFISGSGDIGIGQQNSPANDKVKRLLAKYAIPQTPRGILDKLYDRIEIRHAVLRDNGVDFPEVIIEQIWRQVLKIDDQEIIKQFAVEFELIANPVWAMPNLGSMLSACRQKKMVTGIVSNAQFYTPQLFTWFLNDDLDGLGFDPGLLFYSYQHEVAKPSPVLFKMAAEKLSSKGIHPVSVLYVGNDMLNDIYPANACGFQTALFAGDRRSLRLRTDDPRCAELSPDLVITDLGQLPQLLSS
jgi:putative hydrolase of the HAD superfamily